MTAHIIGAVIGVIVAIPMTIIPTRKFLKPRAEKAFYSLTLIPIALIYVGFVYYYGDLDAMHAEIVGVIIFAILALLAQFMATWILIHAYVLHAAWDVLHEVFVGSVGTAIPWAQVPMGYAAFCLVYDLIIAAYVYKRLSTWE